MFAAPINDLRKALLRNSLGSLNPFPWVVMTGNCAGWLIYGFFTRDPFIIASNLPGFLLSFWLNMGAAKLQYLELCEEKLEGTSYFDEESSEEETEVEGDEENPVAVSKANDYGMAMLPQERSFISVLIFWSIILIWTTWLYPKDMDPKIAVGILVNCNLVLFYGAPLNTMRTVIQKGNSESIHRGTMMMNLINTIFWIIYGFARKDPVIVFPNAIGLVLGVVQGILCLVYPRRRIGSVDPAPLLSQNSDIEQGSEHTTPLLSDSADSEEESQHTTLTDAPDSEEESQDARN